jgi:hypothetical protein
MKDAEVINCKSLSIRADPENVERYEDIVETVKVGTHLTVDTDDAVYSWNDRLYYKVCVADEKKGYALSECLKIGKEVRT